MYTREVLPDFQVQALFVVNILQFIFFALKLDDSILTWNYAVSPPLWGCHV